MSFKKIFLLGLVVLFVFSGYQLLADEKEPAQVRIVLNASKALTENSDLCFRFVFPNIVGSHYPNVWFGPRKRFNENFSLAFMLGRTFRKENNTLILSVFPVFNFGKWSIWNEIDYNVAPGSGYNFTEIRYSIWKDWLKVGIDNENVFGRNGFYSAGPAVDVVLTDHICITYGYFFKWADSQRKDFFRFYLKFF